MKRFIYLIQARQESPCFDALRSDQADCLVLYWKPNRGRPIRSFHVRHPHWSDTLQLFANDRMARGNGDGGDYEFIGDSRLLLRWDNWPVETVEWDPSRALFCCKTQGTTLREIPIPASTMPNDMPSIDAIGSTWNTGRNRLLKRALEMGHYEYLIFMDDDVTLEDLDSATNAAAFRTFEQFLEEYQPAVGFCSGGWHTRRGASQAVTAPHAFDACLNAFRADTLRVLLPYYEGFDSISWWWSHELLLSLCSLTFRGEAMQCNTLQYTNALSAAYPRQDALDVSLAHEFLASSIRDRDVATSLPTYPNNRQIDYPLSPRSETRIGRAQLTRNFDLEHIYWRDKIQFWQSTIGEWL